MANIAAGLHWVGERGPQLLDFRDGETVYDHQESVAMVANRPRMVTGTGKNWTVATQGAQGGPFVGGVPLAVR